MAAASTLPQGSTAAAAAAGGRMRFLDLLRALASQLIVLHHLAFYGPLSDIAYPLAPGVIDWFFSHGRLAVQVFFVVGGMLAAKAVARETPSGLRALAAAVGRRYKRIGGPYVATLALAVAANAVAGRWMDHDSISAAPSVGQLLAHVLFLQSILGYEALTAGIWYLAVDFQLGLLVLAVAALSARLARAFGLGPEGALPILQALLAPLALASLLWFNRQARFDPWAVYFFGSFFLGMMLEWALSRRLPATVFALYLATVVGAGCFDWRPRLLAAAGTAGAIFLAARLGQLWSWPRSRVIAFLGRISYSLFLVHFPVCLLTSAWFSRRGPPAEPMAALGMGVGYLLSLGAAVLFHFAVELRFTPRPRATPGTAAAGAQQPQTGS